MGRFFWKQEKSNHHFPELNSKITPLKVFIGFLKPAAVAGVLVVTVFGLGSLYLIQTNKNATAGYQLKDLENKIFQLKEYNRKLNMAYIELQSMDNLIAKAGNLKLVPINHMEIITPLDTAVALK